MSQHPAVQCGIITAEVAFCGLSFDDVSRLAKTDFACTKLIVSFRNRRGDGRAVFTARELAAGRAFKTSAGIFTWLDVREVVFANKYE